MRYLTDRKRAEGKGAAHAGTFDGRTAAEARVHQESVIDLRQPVDRVHVGGEKSCRLRFSDGDYALGFERPEYAVGLRVPDQSTCLRVDIEGVRVSGMRQRAVPFGVDFLEWRSRHAHGGGAAFDAHFLRGDRDIGVATANHFAMRDHPIGRRILASGDIEPLDQHRAVELRCVTRPRYNDARLEGSGARGRCVPAPSQAA